jgi:hypothetical protein
MKGQTIIERVSERFGLPEWWVEAVAVEYFDCRKYLVDGHFWSFDFNMLTNEDKEEIPRKRVVVGSFILFQNLRPEDLKTRMLLGMVGAPIAPLHANIVAEGPVSDHYVPFQSNSIDDWDSKLGFGQYAQVSDDGRFYQWRISEFHSVPGSPRGWYKSDFLDLEPLRQINEEIRKLRNQPIPQDDDLLKSLRENASEAYANLERTRCSLRKRILEYHEANKRAAITPAVTGPPAVITYLDSFKIAKGKDGRYEYRIQSHVEPLFYRRALEFLKETKEIVENRTRDKAEAISIVDEIESSAACIVFCALCLETYINLVGEEYCQKVWSDTYARANLATKWISIPYVLGSPDCFELNSKPYSDFIKVVKWRNQIVHPEVKFKKTQPIQDQKQASRIYSICNLKNAELAVETTRAMIVRLSNKTPIKIPSWLERFDEWRRLLP